MIHCSDLTGNLSCGLFGVVVLEGGFEVHAKLGCPSLVDQDVLLVLRVRVAVVATGELAIESALDVQVLGSRIGVSVELPGRNCGECLVGIIAIDKIDCERHGGHSRSVASALHRFDALDGLCLRLARGGRGLRGRKLSDGDLFLCFCHALSHLLVK